MKRFRRFSLRTLILAMLLVAIWLAWKRHSSQQQKLVAEFILSRNGYVGYDFEYDPSAYRLKNPVLSTSEELIEALGIDWFHSIVWVELTGKPVGDHEVAKVACLKSTRGLVVSGYEIPTSDDDGVQYISPDISALSLERIGKLRRLQRLRIDVGEAEANGLAGWHKLSKLEQLVASSVDDSHLVHLARVPNLKRLELWGKVNNDHVAQAFSEEALLNFAESTSLQELGVTPHTCRPKPSPS